MALGKKATLKISGESAFVALRNLVFGGRTWGEEDITPHDGNEYTTRARTLKTIGKVTFDLTPFDESDADHAALLTLARSGAYEDFVFTYPNGTNTETFEAWVSAKPITPAPSVFGYSFELTPTGDSTYA